MADPQQGEGRHQVAHAVEADGCRAREEEDDQRHPEDVGQRGHFQVLHVVTANDYSLNLKD